MEAAWSVADANPELMIQLVPPRVPALVVRRVKPLEDHPEASHVDRHAEKWPVRDEGQAERSVVVCCVLGGSVGGWVSGSVGRWDDKSRTYSRALASISFRNVSAIHSNISAPHPNRGGSLPHTDHRRLYSSSGASPRGSWSPLRSPLNTPPGKPCW